MSDSESGMQIDHWAPVEVADAFNRHLVYDKILSHLSPAALIRMGRVSKLTRNAVQDFSCRAFDINQALRRFLSDPLPLRSLQARTGTLISGSFALQFFDRTFYPESDLDIYTARENCSEIGRMLVQDGYQFTPNSWQEGDFEAAIATPQADASMVGLNQAIDQHPNLQPNMFPPGWNVQHLDEEHLQQYRLCRISEVFTFIRQSGTASDSKLRVQIIIPKSTPFECVLAYHSTCVMNVITYNAAYSLYPYATFERREALAISLDDRQGIALRKYSNRGWRIISPASPLVIPSSKTWITRASHFYLGTNRWVVDGKSWKIALDTTGVVGPPAPSPSSKPITWDPVAECSWALKAIGERLEVKYFLTSSHVLKHHYTIASNKYFDMLVQFFKTQGTLEYSKLPATENAQTESKPDYWTWWDSELPIFREEYLRMLGEKGEEPARLRGYEVLWDDEHS